ncbi:class E sortase [Kitasatospora sp. NBC_00070]|uniref:class E sortase n=1 Tax=Kitasatospora sp. NBC_00070 TaxID=2975962 RepID=UPI003249772D
MSAPTSVPPTVRPEPGPDAPAAAAPRDAGPPPAAPKRAAVRPPLGTARRRLVQAGWATTSLAVLVIGFGAFLPTLSGLQEQHAQAAAYKTLREQFGTAVAPTGPTVDGAPVAMIDIPALGLYETVVVEGTTGRDLMRGPGHRRDTVLPGQQGVSVLFGRRVSFGAPFARIAELHEGDRIDVTTGQGKSSYVVNEHGEGGNPLTDQAENRLVLVTGDSDWISSSTVMVGARLLGEPYADAGTRGALRPTDKALAADRSALSALQLWTLGLLGCVTLTTLAVRLWHRWAAYLCSAPVLGAVLWSCYENAAALLPNLY